jgi:OOP family OmpA-OmpF porin
MKTSVKLTAAVLTVGLLAGCAGPNQRVNNDNIFCAVMGGLAGGAVTGAVTDGSDAALGGAAIGAVAGLLLCPRDEVEAAAVVATPTCPMEVPAGALTDAQGCAYDSDADGVVDGIDMCAMTPEGVSVDAVGCALDSDKDAVPDYRDLCPHTASGTIVDPDGCPLKGEKILSLNGVFFDFNKSSLTAEAKATLEDAVTVLKDVDSMVEVKVEGHTDSIGSEAYNLKLSQERAESVVNFLVESGINPDYLIAVGMGETSPIASNETAAGREVNRRVDFVVK